MPNLYVEEFVGITNRLETLPLAFAIRKDYGRTDSNIMVLDPELSAVQIEKTANITWM